MQSKMDIPEKLGIQSTQDGEKHNTTRAGHHHTQVKTNSANKTWGKDEPNIASMRNSQWVT